MNKLPELFCEALGLTPEQIEIANSNISKKISEEIDESDMLKIKVKIIKMKDKKREKGKTIIDCDLVFDRQEYIQTLYTELESVLEMHGIELELELGEDNKYKYNGEYINLNKDTEDFDQKLKYKFKKDGVLEIYNYKRLLRQKVSLNLLAGGF